MEGFNPVWLIVVGLFAIAAVVYLMLRRKGELPSQPAPTPAPLPGPSESPPAVFIDRDDLLKWIGTSKYQNAVTLDGVTVHGGFGPPLLYVSGEGTPDKNIRRA